MSIPSVSGIIIHTTNSGISWTISSYPDSLRVMLAVTIFDQNRAYGIGACNLSTGAHQFHFPGFVFARNKNIPYGLNAQLLSEDTNTGGYFIKTYDKGRTWQTYGAIAPEVKYLTGGCFTDTNTGFGLAITLGGLYQSKTGIIKTTNGGLSWIFVSSPDSAQELYGIDFFDPNTGIAIGYDRVQNSHFGIQGLIMRTSDNGNTWSRQLFYDVDNFKGLAIANSTTGFACGVSNSDSMYSSVIYKTTIAGLSWFELPLKISGAMFQGINFVKNSGAGYVYGDQFTEISKAPWLYSQSSYLISKTTDYGQNWFTNNFPDSSQILVNGYAVDSSNWYISGGNLDNGYILHTTNGGGVIGIRQTGTEVPAKFVLGQNYPNPFNPSTKIKFELPVSSEVIFKVYDVIGREVYKITESAKRPGMYTVDFDGSGLASGVYFYRLTAGNFSQVRKMVILK